MSVTPANPIKTQAQTQIQDGFADENANSNPNIAANVKTSVGNESVAEGLKRSRSGNAATMVSEKETEVGNKARRKSGSPEKNSDWSEFLPDSKDFEDAIIAAVLGSSTEPEKMKFAEKLEKGKLGERKIEKRLKDGDRLVLHGISDIKGWDFALMVAGLVSVVVKQKLNSYLPPQCRQ
ncbi:hypothetical protein Tco_1302557 [Tanacetum coccineum]